MEQDGYPEYPDLTDSERNQEIARVWIERETWSPLWHAAVLAEFMRAVRVGEPVDAWILGWLYEKFHYVLAGSAWDDAFSLPERSIPDSWHTVSRKQRRDTELFAEIANAVRAGQRTTEAIAQTAMGHHVSFETARAAYYEWKKQLGQSHLRAVESSNQDDGGLEERDS